MHDLTAAARAAHARTVATRRDLHAHPEIAFEEVRTARIVAERLREAGLEPRTGVGRTGVVAVLDGALPGRTVLARADMDALPVAEETTAAYRSTIPGRMHACGHDGHTAVLLSVAELLAQRRATLAGRVVFLFQPAEEIVQGADAMIADGALSGLAPDHAVGLHLTTMLPTGTVGVRPGPAMAATDRFDVRVRGSGGHAAKPQETIDPVLTAAAVVMALQAVVSRECDPVDQAVLSVTSVQGGTAYNIIPDEVVLKGTLRSFEPTTRELLRERVAEIARGVASAHRARADVTILPGSAAVVNDPGVTARLEPVLAQVVGAERVVRMPLMMGGDDMAAWLQRAPGLYYFVGARGGDDSAHPHHHARFDIDEAALPVAVETLARCVLELLAP